MKDEGVQWQGLCSRERLPLPGHAVNTSMQARLSPSGQQTVLAETSARAIPGAVP